MFLSLARTYIYMVRDKKSPSPVGTGEGDAVFTWEGFFPYSSPKRIFIISQAE